MRATRHHKAPTTIISTTLLACTIAYDNTQKVSVNVKILTTSNMRVCSRSLPRWVVNAIFKGLYLGGGVVVSRLCDSLVAVATNKFIGTLDGAYEQFQEQN